MKILILTLGSRGDVQPFVALGRGLLAAGYDVALCTADLFADFVQDHGVPYAHMPAGYIRLIETDQGREAFESGSRARLGLINQAKPHLRAMLDAAWAAAQDANLIVYHPKALAGYHIAQKRGVTGIMSMPLPQTPTRAFPNPILPPSVPGFLRRLSYRVGALARAPFMSVINEWRETVLGLPPRGRFASEDVDENGRSIPTLYSYSPLILPDPPDWPDNVTATGCWFLDHTNDWQPPRELVDFLDAGPPPVYVGFGSMPSKNAAAKGRLVVAALQQAGQRGILASGWGGLQAADLPPTVFMLERAPHDWLFPQMAAVVHHGGAGTTAAGLRAGKPAVIAPFFGDQPFWARRLYELGVGPAPVPQKALNVDDLAAAIRQAVADDAMRQRAAALGVEIRAEDGVARAVEIVGQLLPGAARAAVRVDGGRAA